MTKEEKDLFLKDLVSRLPYNVRCSFGVDDAVYEITGINPTCCGASEIQATHISSSINGDFRLDSCKPYLFPLSSMTEEQSKVYHELIGGMFGTSALVNFEVLTDFFNTNHLDYRGLIPKGLAIDATNLNIY